MRNITQFLFMLTLSFYIAFAPAAANADDFTTMSQNVGAKLDELDAKLKARAASWNLSSTKPSGAAVEVTAQKTYPVSIVNPATGAVATETATATTVARIAPTAARIAKGIAGGVVTNLIALAIYDKLSKSVDYVLDPANNRVTWTDTGTDFSSTYNGHTYTGSTGDSVCQKLLAAEFPKSSWQENTITASYSSTEKGCKIYLDGNVNWRAVVSQNVKTQDAYMTFDEVATRSQDIANRQPSDPRYDSTALANIQSSLQAIVRDMQNTAPSTGGAVSPTNNELNEILNNVSDNYYNSDGSPSSNAQTYNNSSANTTLNNYTTNITNINNYITKKDDTAASTTTPTASTTTPTDSKPFELPAFCDWAKPVCDFVEWVKKDPADNAAEPVDVQDVNPPFDIDTLALKPYISLPAECPANPAWQFMGGQIVLPLNIVCDGFSMASWLVMAFAWLRGLVIVGSTFKG